MATDEIGILLVGAGFIADAHSAAVAVTPGARIAGIVDVDPGRAAAFARSQGGIPHESDLAAALAWPDVDAAIVCTPNFTHAAIGAAVAGAGKHLLIEKPLTITVADARALQAAFSGKGLVLAAAHTHRAYDYGRAVKAAVAGIGEPFLVRLAILGGWIWPDWSAWVADPAKSGGHALHNGVHLLDLATWWLDARPVAVSARGHKQTAAELGIYDYLEMVVDYANGATAVCEMSRAHRPGSFNQRELFVAGSGGAVRQDWDGEAAVLYAENGPALVPAAGGNGFALQLRAWLDSIGGAPPLMPVDDAVLAVAMGVAAERSIQTGERVTLDEVLA
ncbi:Gfo/Idh/MocA family oxidoreductase [Dactylosporangium sp. NPDC049140]|uniref:Gfo/Idh/MocA family protein n=1 Tax=Dactylosporangium sp. NPDC049140 TaxID=3155647 RepID=UPI0033EB6BF3